MWQSGSKESRISKYKNIINKNKKLLCTYVCFPFHHSTCTWKVQVQEYLYFVMSLRKKDPEILSSYRKVQVRENPYSNIFYSVHRLYLGERVYYFSYTLIENYLCFHLFNRKLWKTTWCNYKIVIKDPAP